MDELVSADQYLAALRALPLGGLDDIVGAAPLLVLAPHPDDETLGCGGLIAAARARAQDVYVAVLSDGSGSHPGSLEWPPARLAALRAREVAEAVAALGLAPDRLGFLGCRDGAVPRDGAAFREVAADIASHVRRSGAGTVLTTWAHDPHQDHQAASALAVRHRGAPAGQAARRRRACVAGNGVDRGRARRGAA